MGTETYSEYFTGMSTTEKLGCQRLEPNNKLNSIEDGIQAKVKDPLFMLGRQWQLSEFRATNGGSLVRTEIEYSSQSLDEVSTFDDIVQNIHISEPLEKIIEEEEIDTEIIDSVENKKPKAKYWNPKQLEYSFIVKHQDTILKSKEYFGQNLDWYNFNFTSLGEMEEIVKHLALKPTEVSFHGMPLKRWWSFENQKIDLGDIQRPYLNYLTEMLVEFAFIYSHNWFLIPIKHSIGHIRSIREINLIDSFGVTLNATPVIDTTEEKQGWEVFTICPDNAESHEMSNGRLFYFPNNLYHDLESKPVEQVIITRDELANLVWAIENKYESFDPYIELDIESHLRELLKNAIVINRRDEEDENEEEIRRKEREKPNLYWEKDPKINEETGEEYFDPDSGMLKENYIGDNEPGNRYTGPVAYYIPKSYMPPHWIPYVPRQLADNQEMVLRRGSTRSNHTLKQYKGIFLSESKYIHEEEIPRTGIVLTRSIQLARDNEGNRLIWWGRKKKPSEYIKSSGLKFDYLVEK